MTTTTTTKTNTIDSGDFSSLLRLASNIPQYRKILVPHDSSQMSDKSLAHAVYISKITGAHIEMLHVIEFARDVPPSTLLAFIAPDKPLEKAKEDLKNTLEAGIRKILADLVDKGFLQFIEPQQLYITTHKGHLFLKKIKKI